MKIINVVGARPNFMKIAPVVEELRKFEEIGELVQILVHTGQHYDERMSKLFFKQLKLPKPDVYLGIGSGTHAQQTARVMCKFERVLMEEKPDLVIVVGDVNSTLACALVSAKLGIKIAHIEAGLRSFDKTMPEEVNRVITDQLSDYLFTTSSDAIKNLLREGIKKEKIHLTGNVMIDTLLKNKDVAEKSSILESLNVQTGHFGVVTLHRPSNVDDDEILRNLIEAFDIIQRKMKLVLPLHPRTKKRIDEIGMWEQLKNMKNMILTRPLGYLDFLKLMSNARLVLTDSGGVQEETTILGIPCLTMRLNTERPITITHGTNLVVGNKKDLIISKVSKILANCENNDAFLKTPRYWDGRAAERIVKVLLENRNEICERNSVKTQSS